MKVAYSARFEGLAHGEQFRVQLSIEPDKVSNLIGSMMKKVNISSNRLYLQVSDEGTGTGVWVACEVSDDKEAYSKINSALNARHDFVGEFFLSKSEGSPDELVIGDYELDPDESLIFSLPKFDEMLISIFDDGHEYPDKLFLNVLIARRNTLLL